MDYKSTLHLPVTSFPMRAGLAEKEPKMLAGWKARDLWADISAGRREAPKFVLHDGPPYANGLLHHGHLLNKILKDIVVKDRTLAGFQTSYVPGWDCHGLPIETQVDKELGAEKATLSRAALYRAYAAHAQKFVSLQKEGFERLGVFGDFEAPYLTMHPTYEAAIVGLFADLCAQGLVYRGLRPVNWCMVHQTALAEAEVEYEDHVSPSLYATFCVSPDQAIAQKADLPEHLRLAIWTTTPWSLAGNLAVAVHEEFQYVVVSIDGNPTLIAEDRLPMFWAAVGRPESTLPPIISRVLGKKLLGLKYDHPFVARQGVVLGATHVTLDAGTGLVHTAPAHGADDFDLCRRHQIPVLSCVDGRGKMMAEAGFLEGLTIEEAIPRVESILQAKKQLLSPPNNRFKHRYPHCWRCHKPIILRATSQWFAALDRPMADEQTLRERALASLESVRWVPGWGEDRIRGMLAARPDWCLSRQRTWGVPILVGYCKQCEEPLVEVERMRRIQAEIEQKGSIYWYEASDTELFADATCKACGHSEFRREHDILDVWFDSGASFSAVLEARGLAHTSGPPADLYLEGSDQHRGWFHSSLLLSLATRNQPPYRTVVTHGFVVDGAGKKISKSRGNFVDSQKAINQSGAEILRMWVACEDYRNDVRLSQEILTRLSDSYRKVRNTLRFLLGNLHDFEPERDWVDVDDLHVIDKVGLAVGLGAMGRARQSFAQYAFHNGAQTLIDLCTTELSAFYLDVRKDCLYAAKKDGIHRKGAQTALYVLLRELLVTLSPILCFTAEEAFVLLPKLNGDPDSVHLMSYGDLRSDLSVATKPRAVIDGIVGDERRLMSVLADVREVRARVNASLEASRQNKLIGSSTAARITLWLPAEAFQKANQFSAALWADWLIVSQVALKETSGEMRVEVDPANGLKCERCWLYREDVGTTEAHASLCRRCVEAIT